MAARYAVKVGHKQIAVGTIDQANRLMKAISEMQTVDDSFVLTVDDGYRRLHFVDNTIEVTCERVNEDEFVADRAAAKAFQVEQARIRAERLDAPTVAEMPACDGLVEAAL